MTQRLFKRTYRLVVDTLEITDLDVQFSVSRSLGATPNTCEISVFNLSENQRKAIDEYKVNVNLLAGYGGENTLIFSGNLRDTQSERTGPDIITKMATGDGELKRRVARVQKSFGPGTSIDAVLKACATAMGLGLGNLSALTKVEFIRGGAIFPMGTVLSGSAARELDEILRSCGLEYSIQNGAIQVLTRKQALTGTAVVLSNDTGLLTQPSVDSRGFATATCLMIPDLFPGRRVQFDTPDLQGFFRVNKADYSGDTRGDDWSVELFCEPLVPVK